MMTINLLPWREEKRKQRKQIIVFTLILIFLLMTFLFLIKSFYSAAEKESELPEPSIELNLVKQLSYIGLVQQGVSQVALIRRPSGKVFFVKKSADFAIPHLKLISLSKTQLHLELDKKTILLKMKKTKNEN